MHAISIVFVRAVHNGEVEGVFQYPSSVQGTVCGVAIDWSVGGFNKSGKASPRDTRFLAGTFILTAGL
jgi:hypothetical protein